MSQASIEALKNLYEGRSCLVFGNGPSLTLDLIERVRRTEGEIFTFAANGFCAVFEDTAFRPTAVCMSNHYGVRKYLHRYPKSTLKFLKKGWQEVVADRPERVHSLPFDCDHEMGVHREPFIKDDHFTLDPAVKNYCGETVLLDFCIPLAFYMGFSEIYLVGVDCDYSKGYFHPDCELYVPKGFRGMSNGDDSIAIPSFRYAHEFLSRHGRGLWKITESARLDFIPTRPWDEVLSRIGGVSSSA